MKDNFIKYLDEFYNEEKKKNGIEKNNNNYSVFFPLRVKLYDKENNNFIVKKAKMTKYLYTRNNCRVYFSDADILMMLLKIENNNIINDLIDFLKEIYKDNTEKYHIFIGNKQYEVPGIKEISSDLLLKNPQDIDITFNDIYVLINLIISKDIASIPLWEGKPNFSKRTIVKYISILEYYYFKKDNSKIYLKNEGFDTSISIYENYETKELRKSKVKQFTDFKKFEKAGIL